MSNAFWVTVKDKTIKILEDILHGTKETREAVEGVQNRFKNFIKPKQYDGESSFEIRYEKNFEETCIVLAQYANKQVKELSVKEYFILLNVYEKSKSKKGVKKVGRR